MPVPFAMAAAVGVDWSRLAAGIVAFCLGSSAIYSLNDVLDAERDRSHPRKCRRPVASGRVRPALALAWSGGLCACALGVSYAIGPEAIRILGAYLVLNVFYCLSGKYWPLIDVFLLSSGFLLRILMGVAMMGVSPSSWLLLCGASLALLLGLSKRRIDLVGGYFAHRPALAGYTREFLDQAIGIAAGVTIISYALYCMDSPVFLVGREFSTLPFVIFGVLDYLRTIHSPIDASSPLDVILSSRMILGAAVGWAVAAIWSIGIL
jgi:hypothetical protein